MEMTPMRASTAEMLLYLKRGTSGEVDSSFREDLGSSGKEDSLSSGRETGSGTVDALVCNCKKSRCLKLYCQCFAARVECNAKLCKCEKCANTQQHEKEREDAVRMILERNPTAFESKFKRESSNDGIKTAHKLGCRCRKSMCLKKYCECFNAGVPCSASCTCLQCANSGPPTSSTIDLTPLLSPPSNASTVKSSCVGRTTSIENTPGTAAMMRAAQDLALLRTKDDVHAAPVAVVNSSKTSPSSYSFTPESRIDTDAIEQLPSADNDDFSNARKRLRSESPVHDSFKNGVSCDRPPTILSRSAKKSSPPLGSGTRKPSPKNTNSQLRWHSTSGDAFFDISTGNSYRFQPPPMLRITSASPNSLYCASALSLLSGLDSSPHSLGSSAKPSVGGNASSGAFFATSPLPRPPSPFKHTNDSPELMVGEASQVPGSVSDSKSRRRPHANSMDSSHSLDNTYTSEEDMTSTAEDSPYVSLLPLPSSFSNDNGNEHAPNNNATGNGPPTISLPQLAIPNTANCSPGHDKDFTCSTASTTSTLTRIHSGSSRGMSNMSKHQSGDILDESNWAKPVVDIMSSLS